MANKLSMSEFRLGFLEFLQKEGQHEALAEEIESLHDLFSETEKA